MNTLIPKRVLSVDDDTDSLELVELHLRPVGYEIVSVASIAEAMERVHNEKFDIYILNHTFEDGTGAELCRKIRAVDTETPIIFHSAAARQIDIDEAMTAGANQYLTKPQGWNTLVETVQHLIKPNQ
jgi:DNA-binding response OmpR family regulator